MKHTIRPSFSHLMLARTNAPFFFSSTFFTKLLFKSKRHPCLIFVRNFLYNVVLLLTGNLVLVKGVYFQKKFQLTLFNRSDPGLPFPNLELNNTKLSKIASPVYNAPVSIKIKVLYLQLLKNIWGSRDRTYE